MFSLQKETNYYNHQKRHIFRHIYLEDSTIIHVGYNFKITNFNDLERNNNKVFKKKIRRQ